MAEQKSPPPIEDGPWGKGIDSYMEATQVQKGFYRWAVNVSNRGGIVRTRPGLSVIPVTTTAGVALVGKPRGITVFTDVNGIPYLVICIGTKIYSSRYPFTGLWSLLPALDFAGTGPVCFTRCVQSAVTNTDHSLTEIDPKPILMMQDGVSNPGYWDGATGATAHITPSTTAYPWGTPKGLWSEWSGSRYWVSYGNKVYASDLLNPLQFYENSTNNLETSGYLQFPGPVTGMTNTYNYKSLLVYTDFTTSTLQTSLLDRTKWATTPGFQTVEFFGIGCVGGNAIATQWGLKWWYSHDGLIGLDEGLRAYQTSKVSYKDREMAWSRGNIAPGFRPGIAVGSFENLLFVSVPSGDIFNAHTWVMDEAPLDVLSYWGYFGLPAWSGVWEGVRPVGWITASIHGANRTFCLSQDYPNNGDPYNALKNNVWEGVTDARVDSSPTTNLSIVKRPITCSLETRLLGYDGNYKFFRFAEIYLDNIEGEVDLTVSYAPRRGGYKVVLRKHIVASDWIIQNSNTQIPVDTFVFDTTRPQTRVVRTISEAKTYTDPNTGDDAFQGVQTSANVPFPRQKDYGFSVLLQWTGRMSVSSVRVYFDPDEQEVEGVAEKDETTDRFVDVDGRNVIGTSLTPYVFDPKGIGAQSNVVTGTASFGTAALWVDPQYNAMS
jgi:hypothetical protein